MFGTHFSLGVTTTGSGSVAIKYCEYYNNIYNDYSLLFTFYAHDNCLVSHLNKALCLTGLSVSSF